MTAGRPLEMDADLALWEAAWPAVEGAFFEEPAAEAYDGAVLAAGVDCAGVEDWLGVDVIKLVVGCSVRFARATTGAGRRRRESGKELKGRWDRREEREPFD